MLFIRSRSCKIQPAACTLDIDGTVVKTSSAARNIGAKFDSRMSLEDHVNQICRSCYLHIRDLGAIRKYLSPSTAASVAHAFIFSKLDYLNSLLVNLPDRLLDKLQRIQNITARIVSRVGRMDHITPVLSSLHWLPVKARISFKVCLMVYRAVNGEAPSYLSDILTIYEPRRCLRSAENGILLSVPKTRTSYGDRAFSAAAPLIWNSLPLTIRSCPNERMFRKSLKTHLFKLHF